MNSIVREDCFVFLDRLPENFADLAIIDPPYNMGKGDWDSFRTDGDKPRNLAKSVTVE